MTARWLGYWGPDPRPWLRTSSEPTARWLCLTALEDLPPSQHALEDARRDVVADPSVQELIERLPDWSVPQRVSGHESPAFAPNLLHLLAELGVRAQDDLRIDRLLEQLLDSQDQDGRFVSFDRVPGSDTPVWGALACDHHAITEVLVRFGHEDDPRVQAALDFLAGTLVTTAQGPGWLCTPHTKTGWRGPGRKGDVCPQVTLEAVRTFARLPVGSRPEGIEEAARTILGVWLRRTLEHPYMFGHGVSFKTVKWPPLWYGIWQVLDTIGREPQVWAHPEAEGDARRAVVELVASLVAYNVSPEGTVTPRSCYRGFTGFTFGTKKAPSPTATALVASVARRFEALASEVEATDALTVASSRGAALPAPPRM